MQPPRGRMTASMLAQQQQQQRLSTAPNLHRKSTPPQTPVNKPRFIPPSPDVLEPLWSTPSGSYHSQMTQTITSVLSKLTHITPKAIANALIESRYEPMFIVERLRLVDHNQRYLVAKHVTHVLAEAFRSRQKNLITVDPEKLRLDALDVSNSLQVPYCFALEALGVSNGNPERAKQLAFTIPGFATAQKIYHPMPAEPGENRYSVNNLMRMIQPQSAYRSNLSLSTPEGLQRSATGGSVGASMSNSFSSASSSSIFETLSAAAAATAQRQLANGTTLHTSGKNKSDGSGGSGSGASAVNGTTTAANGTLVQPLDPYTVIVGCLADRPAFPARISLGSLVSYVTHSTLHNANTTQCYVVQGGRINLATNRYRMLLGNLETGKTESIELISPNELSNVPTDVRQGCHVLRDVQYELRLTPPEASALASHGNPALNHAAAGIMYKTAMPRTTMASSDRGPWSRLSTTSSASTSGQRSVAQDYMVADYSRKLCMYLQQLGVNNLLNNHDIQTYWSKQCKEEYDRFCEDRVFWLPTHIERSETSKNGVVLTLQMNLLFYHPEHRRETLPMQLHTFKPIPHLAPLTTYRLLTQIQQLKDRTSESQYVVVTNSSQSRAHLYGNTISPRTSTSLSRVAPNNGRTVSALSIRLYITRLLSQLSSSTMAFASRFDLSAAGGMPLGLWPDQQCELLQLAHIETSPSSWVNSLFLPLSDGSQCYCAPMIHRFVLRSNMGSLQTVFTSRMWIYAGKGSAKMGALAHLCMMRRFPIQNTSTMAPPTAPIHTPQLTQPIRVNRKRRSNNNNTTVESQHAKRNRIDNEHSNANAFDIEEDDEEEDEEADALLADSIRMLGDASSGPDAMQNDTSIVGTTSNDGLRTVDATWGGLATGATRMGNKAIDPVSRVLATANAMASGMMFDGEKASASMPVARGVPITDSQGHLWITCTLVLAPDNEVQLCALKMRAATPLLNIATYTKPIEDPLQPAKWNAFDVLVIPYSVFGKLQSTTVFSDYCWWRVVLYEPEKDRVYSEAIFNMLRSGDSHRIHNTGVCIGHLSDLLVIPNVLRGVLSVAGLYDITPWLAQYSPAGLDAALEPRHYELLTTIVRPITVYVEPNNRMTAIPGTYPANDDWMRLNQLRGSGGGGGGGGGGSRSSASIAAAAPVNVRQQLYQSAMRRSKPQPRIRLYQIEVEPSETELMVLARISTLLFNQSLLLDFPFHMLVAAGVRVRDEERWYKPRPMQPSQVRSYQDSNEDCPGCMESFQALEKLAPNNVVQIRAPFLQNPSEEERKRPCVHVYCKKCWTNWLAEQKKKVYETEDGHRYLKCMTGCKLGVRYQFCTPWYKDKPRKKPYPTDDLPQRRYTVEGCPEKTAPLSVEYPEGTTLEPSPQAPIIVDYRMEKRLDVVLRLLAEFQKASQRTLVLGAPQVMRELESFARSRRPVREAVDDQGNIINGDPFEETDETRMLKWLNTQHKLSHQSDMEVAYEQFVRQSEWMLFGMPQDRIPEETAMPIFQNVVCIDNLFLAQCHFNRTHISMSRLEQLILSRTAHINLYRFTTRHTWEHAMIQRWLACVPTPQRSSLQTRLGISETSYLTDLPHTVIESDSIVELDQLHPVPLQPPTPDELKLPQPQRQHVPRREIATASTAAARSRSSAPTAPTTGPSAVAAAAATGTDIATVNASTDDAMQVDDQDHPPPLEPLTTASHASAPAAAAATAATAPTANDSSSIAASAPAANLPPRPSARTAAALAAAARARAVRQQTTSAQSASTSS